MNKQKFLLTVAVLICSVILIGFASALPWKAEAESQTNVQADKKVLNVSGEGTVYASPDIAYITLGTVTEDKIAKTAQQKNADIMAEVVAKIKAAGIKSEDIKTVNYSIYPRYNYIEKTGERQIIGYSVTNSIQVTVRDINKTGSIIDLASSSGANTASSISFGLSDYDKYYNEALKKATEAAKGKAKVIAETMDIYLKSPVSITENGGSQPIYNYGVSYDLAKAAEASPTPVQSGNITVRAGISITYEY